MNLGRVLAILGKDVRDAFRDGRVLIALILPIGLAVIYNATAPERGERPSSEIVVVDRAGDGLASALRQSTRRSVDLEVRRADSEQRARQLVADDDADLAVIAGGAGAGPARATVVIPDDASATTQAVANVVPDAVAAAAGREPASQVAVQSVRIDAATQDPGQLIEPRILFIALSIVMLAGFVALLVVPLQTAEELETGTFSALRLAATGPEILAAKALGGIIYGLVGSALIAVITRADPADLPLFLAAVLLLVVSMVGFGLLLGLLSRNATQINTYSSFLLFPVVGLAVAVLFVDGGIFGAVLDVLPFTQAMKLLVNGLAPEQPFDLGLLPWVVVLAWTVLGFLALARYTTRREV